MRRTFFPASIPYLIPIVVTGTKDLILCKGAWRRELRACPRSRSPRAVTASLRPRDRLEDEETYAFKEWEPGERFGIMMTEEEDASASQEWEPEVRFSYDPGSTTRRN